MIIQKENIENIKHAMNKQFRYHKDKKNTRVVIKLVFLD